jgi:hypothetical protein
MYVHIVHNNMYIYYRLTIPYITGIFGVAFVMQFCYQRFKTDLGVSTLYVAQVWVVSLNTDVGECLLYKAGVE